MLGSDRQIEDLLCCARLRDVRFTWIEAEQIPQPYLRLLHHDKDMTSTLAAFHGGEVDLQVFQSEKMGNQYFREVLLSVGGKPVEYGAIVIYLDRFSPEIRERILGEKEPLGHILNSSGLAYTSSPRGWLQYPDAGFTEDIFPPAGGASLYGRYNALSNSGGEVLARILEILPIEKQ